MELFIPNLQKTVDHRSTHAKLISGMAAVPGISGGLRAAAATGCLVAFAGKDSSRGFGFMSSGADVGLGASGTAGLVASGTAGLGASGTARVGASGTAGLGASGTASLNASGTGVGSKASAVGGDVGLETGWRTSVVGLGFGPCAGWNFSCDLECWFRLFLCRSMLHRTGWALHWNPLRGWGWGRGCH